MKIIDNIQDDRNRVTAARMDHFHGHVVQRYRGGRSAGPYLVCYENSMSPLKVSGCPNGGVRTFLVALDEGWRVNIDDDDLFEVIDVQLNIKAA